VEAPKWPGPIGELMVAAGSLPSGPVKMSLLEEAIRIADSLRDTDAGYRIRRAYIDVAQDCMRCDVYIVTFSWCLAVAQERPDRYPVADLLNHYHGVLGWVGNFPHIARTDFEALFDDALAKYRAHGFSLRILYLKRRSVAIDFGDRAMAAAADGEFRKHPRPDGINPVEWEAGWQIYHDRFVGDEGVAVRTADAFFALPGRTGLRDALVANLSLLPLLHVGRTADAAARFDLGQRPLKLGSGFGWDHPDRLEYLARTGDSNRAFRHFEAQLPVALAQTDALTRYRFLRPVAALLARMEAEGVREVSLNAPESLPWYDPDGVYPLAVVGDWARREATDIAALFDRRNGSDYYTDWLRITERTFLNGSPRGAIGNP